MTLQPQIPQLCKARCRTTHATGASCMNFDSVVTTRHTLIWRHTFSSITLRGYILSLGYLPAHEVYFKERVDIKPVQARQLMHLKQPLFLS